MKKTLFRALLAWVMLAAGLVLLAAAAPTYAQCTPNEPATGGTSICSGTDANGYYAGNDQVRVFVNDGATVTNTESLDNNAIRVSDNSSISNNGTVIGTANGDGIKGENNNTVVNNGTIASPYNDGIDMNNGTTVVNNGEITTGLQNGTTHGDKALELDSNATVENNGTIHANGDGVFVLNSAHITNNEGGTIHSETEEAIQGRDGVVVDNYGTISNGGTNYEAVELENYSTVNNYGTISGSCDGIDVNKDSQVINYGTITSENCHAVDGGMGTIIINGGTIETDMETGKSGIEVDYDGVLINEGDIIARCRGFKGLSDATIENSEYGTIHGELCDGVDIDGTAEVYNYGNITTGSGADAGLEVEQGYIENTGLIDGGQAGVRISGTTTAPTTITNDGTIVGKTGIIATGGAGSQTVINDGTIIGEQGVAINLGAGNDTVDTAAGAVIEGLIDGGEGYDLLSFRYVFEARDFYIPDEYRAMEQRVLSAPTTGCPCVLELVISGKSYRYRYANVEQLQSFLEFVQLQYDYNHHAYTANGFTAYALTNNGFRTGQIAVYHTVTGQGVQISSFDAWTVGSSRTITGADGWQIVVDDAGMEGTTRVLSMSVLDATGSVRGTTQILLFNNGSMAWR